MRPRLPAVAQTGLSRKIPYPSKVQVVRAVFKMPRLMRRHEFIQTQVVFSRRILAHPSR